MQKTPKLVPHVQSGEEAIGKQNNMPAENGGAKRKALYLLVLLLIGAGTWVAYKAKEDTQQQTVATVDAEPTQKEFETTEVEAEGTLKTSQPMEMDAHAVAQEGTNAQQLHIAALEKRAQELTALVEKQEAQLKTLQSANPTTVEGAAPGPQLPGAPSMQLNAMQEQLDRLTQRLTVLETRSPSGDDAAFRLLSLVWQIERKMTTGEPFREELIALQQRAMTLNTPQSKQVLELATPLETPARDGVAQPQTLYWEYRGLVGSLAGQLRKAESKEDGIMDFLGGLVTIRRTEEVSLGDGDALLTRLEEALQAGNLGIAQKEAAALQERVANIANTSDREKAERWLERLQQSAKTRDNINAMALALTTEG